MKWGKIAQIRMTSIKKTIENWFDKHCENSSVILCSEIKREEKKMIDNDDDKRNKSDRLVDIFVFNRLKIRWNEMLKNFLLQKGQNRPIFFLILFRTKTSALFSLLVWSSILLHTILKDCIYNHTHVYVILSNIVLLSKTIRLTKNNRIKHVCLTKIVNAVLKSGEWRRSVSSKARMLIHAAKHLKIPMNRCSLKLGSTWRRHTYECEKSDIQFKDMKRRKTN